MAASKGSGITAVHFALMFFVMTSIMLGVTTYLFYTNYTDADAAMRKAADEKNKQLDAARTYAQERDAIKALLGITFEDVGLNNPTPTSVLGEGQRQLQQNGAELQPGQPNTFVTQLIELRRRLDAVSAERNQLAATIVAKDQELLALNQRYQAETDKYKEDANAREADLRGEQAKAQEQIASIEKTIQDLRQQHDALRAEKDQLDQQMQEKIAASEKTIGGLEEQIGKFRDQLLAATNTSFERPLGEIVRVSRDARAVWISLGSADDLRVGTSFSVYKKNHEGVGQTTASDIKGSIEVTNIVEPHLAEARVVSDQLDNPIASKDPIYTPLWKPNQSLDFAVAGVIDFDGVDLAADHKSDDRDMLHELIRSMGGRITSEVNDKGERTGIPIDERVKFLIIGSIPDPTQVATDEERKEINDIGVEMGKMKKEADHHGVRIVNLGDFLSWAGYVARKRVWQPGQMGGYTLQSGQPNPATILSPNSAVSGHYAGGRRQRMSTTDTILNNPYRGGATNGY